MMKSVQDVGASAFEAIRESLTERLAGALTAEIQAMGSRANTELSWLADFRVSADLHRKAA